MDRRDIGGIPIDEGLHVVELLLDRVRGFARGVFDDGRKMCGERDQSGMRKHNVGIDLLSFRREGVVI